MDFWDHLEELRYVLLKSLAVIACFFILSLACYQPLLKAVVLPLENNTPVRWVTMTASNQERQEQRITLPPYHKLSDQPQRTNEASYTLKPGESLTWQEPLQSYSLALLGPTEGLTVMLKISLWTSLLVSSPLWLFFFARFISPGLKTKEKRWLLPFTLFAIALLAVGASFAYWITIPLANRFLLGLNQSMAKNIWSLSQYVNYTLLLLIGNALAFESLALFLLAIHRGWVHSTTLCRYRKQTVIALFVLSAVLTPPDVITQVLLATPLWVFYELGILYAKRKERALKRISG